MSEYHDDFTRASDPGQIVLCDEKLRQFHPSLYTRRARILGRGPRWLMIFEGIIGWTYRWRDIIAEHVQLGDSRAALVITVNPLVVAAYTDELDCVLLLRFDKWVANQYKLRTLDRLLTVNTYTFITKQAPQAPDVIFGPRQCNRYSDFWPIVADFVTEDGSRLDARKSEISEDEWDRTRSMAQRLVEHPKWPPRDGAPLHSQFSVTQGNSS